MKMILCMLLPGRLEPITFQTSDRNSKSFSQKIVLNGLPESLGPYGILPKCVNSRWIH